MENTINKALRYMFSAAVVYLAVSLLTLPEVCISAAKNALLLCFNTVIPSLFPFFVCSSLFVALGLAKKCSRYLSPVVRPLFNVPGCGALCFILGIISGYPTGALCANELYSLGECSKEDAERMMAFCNNSGPLFIIGALGFGILGDSRIGQYLYFSHVLAAILTGICLRFFGKRQKEMSRLLPCNDITVKGIGSAFAGGIDSAVASILKVCSLVLIFSVFSAVLPKSSMTPYIHAALEITGGIAALSACDLEPLFKISLISFFLSFSGISVILQVSAISSANNLSMKPYIFGKLMQGVFSFIITYLLFTYRPITDDVFSDISQAVPNLTLNAPKVFLISFISMLIGYLCLTVLYTIVKICARRGLK